MKVNKVLNLLSFVLFCGYFFSILGLLLILATLWYVPSIRKWMFNLLIAADQFGNTILRGDVDETISSRLGRAYLSLKPKWFALWAYHAVDWIAEVLFQDYNHCIAAIEFEKRPAGEIWHWENN